MYSRNFAYLSNKDLILQNVEWFLSVYLLYVDIENSVEFNF